MKSTFVTGMAAFALVWTLGAMLLLSSCGRDDEQLPTGVLREVSALPDPSESPYPDCLQVVHVSDLRNWPEDLDAPSKAGVLLAWQGFVDRKLTEQASLIAGDAISFRLVPSDQLDEDWTSTNRADSVAAFDLDLYFVEDVVHVSDFRAEKGRISPVDEAVGALKSPRSSLAEVLAMPVERRSSATSQRRKQIDNEIRRIEAAAVKNGGWSAWNTALKPFYIELLEKTEQDGGLRRGNHFFERSYNHRFSELLSLDEPPALKMLVALDRELARKGIDLLVVPFPLKEEINADLFADISVPGESLAPDRLRTLLWLLKHDVEVVDLAPIFRRHREGYGENSYPLFYDFEDHHPAQGGIDLAAAVIAQRLERYDFKKSYDDLVQNEITFVMPEKYRQRFEFAREGARYPASQVLQADATPLPGRPRTSPLLLAGDSFTRVPVLYGVRNAGLREKIALQSGVLPHTLSIAGSASKIMRNLRREGPGYLDGIEVCLFVFAQYPIFEEVDEEGNMVKSDSDNLWEIVPLP